MEKRLIDQEGKKKDHQFLFILLSGLSLLLIVGAILVAVIVPLVNKLPKTIHGTYELTPTLLEDTSKYTYENHTLTITEEEMSVAISTPNMNSGIGVPLYNFIFTQPDGENSEINISFAKSDIKIIKFSVEIYLSDNHGENIVILSEEEYTVTTAENTYVANVKYSSDIYLHHVIFHYDYLVN